MSRPVVYIAMSITQATAGIYLCCAGEPGLGAFEFAMGTLYLSFLNFRWRIAPSDDPGAFGREIDAAGNETRSGAHEEV